MIEVRRLCVYSQGEGSKMSTTANRLRWLGVHLLPWTAARAKHLVPVFIALTIWLPPSLSAQAAPRSSGREARLVRVPFVGCESDGQHGPLAAPKGVDEEVQIDASAAQRLAYYKAGIGVLAPRGWYCAGTYGSGGSSLYVTPQPIKGREFFSAEGRAMSGPVVQVNEIYGWGSGMFEMARFVARVFPAQKAFVQGAIDEGIPASEYPFGPYPTDKLTYRGDRIVEYQTPPHAEGLGTMSGLKAGDSSISGVAILQGHPYNLLVLGVRLPHDMDDLASHIMRQVE